MQESSTNDTTHPAVLAFRQDLEQQLRAHVREAIETVLEAELTAALGSGRHERTARRAGYRHGTVDRTLTTPPVPMIYETTSLLRLVSGRGGFDG